MAEDINEIIRRFLDFKTIQIHDTIQFTPDVQFFLLSIDGKCYVLNKTDWFDPTHEGNGIKSIFGLNVSKWLKPNKKYRLRYEDRVTRELSGGFMTYALAEVEQINSSK